MDGRRHGETLPVVSVAQQRSLRDLARSATSHDATRSARWRSTIGAASSAVVGRADNGFRVGIPFIWCSNNLMASFATQALLYRRMTGDDAFREYEQAALDWLFGTNPWGVSMVIGYPQRRRVGARSALRRRATTRRRRR